MTMCLGTETCRTTAAACARGSLVVSCDCWLPVNSAVVSASPKLLKCNDLDRHTRRGRCVKEMKERVVLDVDRVF